MKTTGRNKQPLTVSEVGEYSWGFTLIFVLASACWALLPYTGPHFAALVFLLAIVIAGLRWNRGPVLMMATMSALVWNFLFIPPQWTLHIASPQDVVMFVLFFVVALSMGHLTTRLRAREDALQRHHHEREQLLAEKHRAELLAESERLHRTLLDSVSHELKTPIAIIRTALDGLGEGNPFAAEIETANRRLQRIVENFLEITRVESDAVRPHLEWCEIGDVLHSATAPLQRELGGHPVTINGNENLPLVMTDGRLLAQALGNVLHNASIYAPSGTPIEVSVAVVDGALELRVRDHGPGVAEGAESRIFEKFFRAPDSAAGGTGLGLAISRGLMRALHGDIAAQNQPGGGAEFILRLPVKTRLA
ncbi:MAG: ATP-binding protein [Verrucomicrobiales bacterium]